jgi:hypothetical protein
METMNADHCAPAIVDAAVEARRSHPLQAFLGARRWLALSGIAALPACSTVPNMPPAPPVPSPEAGYVSYLTPYRIQIGDVLEIRLLLNPELNEDVTVRPDGHISTTVVNDQLAYGMTVPQLAAALRRDYSSQLQNPHLTVVVRSFAPTRIYVGGEVNNPGEFITVGPPLRQQAGIPLHALRRARARQRRERRRDARALRRGLCAANRHCGGLSVLQPVRAAVRAGQLGLLLRGRQWRNRRHDGGSSARGALTHLSVSRAPFVIQGA